MGCTEEFGMSRAAWPTAKMHNAAAAVREGAIMAVEIRNPVQNFDGRGKERKRPNVQESLAIEGPRFRETPKGSCTPGRYQKRPSKRLAESRRRHIG